MSSCAFDSLTIFADASMDLSYIRRIGNENIMTKLIEIEYRCVDLMIIQGFLSKHNPNLVDHKFIEIQNKKQLEELQTLKVSILKTRVHQPCWRDMAVKNVINPMPDTIWEIPPLFKFLGNTFPLLTRRRDCNWYAIICCFNFLFIQIASTSTSTSPTGSVDEDSESFNTTATPSPQTPTNHRNAIQARDEWDSLGDSIATNARGWEPEKAAEFKLQMMAMVLKFATEDNERKKVQRIVL